MNRSMEERGLSTDAGSTPPSGFVEVRESGGWGWVRPEASSWFRESLAEFGSLYEAARTQQARSGGTEPTLQGRAAVFAVPLEFATVAVRHYFRGGAVASLLGDRYLRFGAPRPVAETLTSERVRTLGIPTPRVMAAAVYPKGLFYRGDIVTEFIRGGIDLGEYLFAGGGKRAGEDERAGALREALSLIDRLAGAGVAHPDLNVKNFLLEVGSSPSKISLLDLDRSTLHAGPAGPLRQSMAGRLRRSLSKWEARTGERLTSEEWRLFDHIPMS